MSDLNTTYNELHFELIKNFIFYIPPVFSEDNPIAKIQQELNKTFLFDIDIEKHKDEILLYDLNNEIIYSPKIEELTYFFLKPAELQKNYFKLVELFQQISDISFDTVIKKYYNSLVNYIEISSHFVNSNEL